MGPSYSMMQPRFAQWPLWWIEAFALAPADPPLHSPPLLGRDLHSPCRPHPWRDCLVRFPPWLHSVGHTNLAGGKSVGWMATSTLYGLGILKLWEMRSNCFKFCELWVGCLNCGRLYPLVGAWQRSTSRIRFTKSMKFVAECGGFRVALNHWRCWSSHLLSMSILHSWVWGVNESCTATKLHHVKWQVAQDMQATMWHNQLCKFQHVGKIWQCAKISLCTV